MKRMRDERLAYIRRHRITNILDELLAEIDRLRLIEAAAVKLVGPEGMWLTISDTQRLTVIEKQDKSDPHYRLCALLEQKE